MKYFSRAQGMSWCVVAASTALLVAPGVAQHAWAQEQGQVFVGNYYGDSVNMYPLTTSGNRAPAAVLPDVLFANPFQIAINHRTGELVVANSGLGGVWVYDRATGALKRVINGPSTGLKSPTGVAVDETRGELYVANFGTASITVYDALASGDISPKRTITSPAMIAPVGLAVDVFHDEIVVSDFLNQSILTFQRPAQDSQITLVPDRQITGGGLKLPKGIALDLDRDEILVAANSELSPNTGVILAFNRTDTGNLSAPLRKLEGSSTKLCNPYSVAVDFINNQIVVANSNLDNGACGQSVAAYGRGDTGDIAPKRTIAGASTMLNYPSSATIYYGGNLGVGNKASSATVSAGGDVTYNITATANGGTILAATLDDNLPTTGGLSWKLKGTDAGKCTLDPATQHLSCKFGTLAKGQSRSIAVYATTSRENCSAGISNQVTSLYNDGTAFLSGASVVSTVTVKCR